MKKINKNFSAFFSNAAAAGYGANQVISFLTDMFQTPAKKSERNRLSQGEAEGTLRPDESSALQELHQSDTPIRGAKNIASTINKLGGAAFAGVNAPEVLKKGLDILGGLGGSSQKKQNTDQPISPDTNQQSGSSQPNSKQTDPQNPQSPANAAQSFINQHPELGIYLDRQMQEGKTPEQAALSAKQHKKYSRDVSQIERDVGMDFIDLINQIFSNQPKRENPAQSNQSLVGFLNTLKQFESDLKARKRG